MNKKKGEVQQFFIQMIGIIVSFALLLYGVYYSKTIITYNNANQLARHYILKMETKGEITGDEKGELKKLLEDKVGVKNVSFEGTTDGKVNYGDDVLLKITFTQDIVGLDMDGLNFTFSKHEKQVVITKISTAKY
jgi:hypothetical protein